MTKEVHSLNENMQLMMEQLILGKQDRFGRSSEKVDDRYQIRFMEVDGKTVFFNEAEAVCDLEAAEPDDLETKPSKSKKQAGKKDKDISRLTIHVIPHYITEEELIAEFGENGWKQLPDAISRQYRFVPAKVEVSEHHISVYSSKTDGHMIKAPHPRPLLHGSLVSVSLGAAIMNGKYVNAVPLYQLEQEFTRYGLAVNRQCMANWMIRLGEEYLAIHNRICDRYKFPLRSKCLHLLKCRIVKRIGCSSYILVLRNTLYNMTYLLYDSLHSRLHSLAISSNMPGSILSSTFLTNR